MSLICCSCSKLGRSNSQSDDEQRHGTGNCQRQTTGDQNHVQTIGDIHVNVTAPNLAPNPEEGPADETNETEYERSVKQILINKRGNLASKISLKYTKLWDFLIQYGVLSDDYARAIQDEHRGERKQARKIIEVIIKRPEKYEDFKRALIDSGQGFIIDKYLDGKVPKMPEQEGIPSTVPTYRPRTVDLLNEPPRTVQENNDQQATTHSDSLEQNQTRMIQDARVEHPNKSPSKESYNQQVTTQSDSVEQEPWKDALNKNQEFLTKHVDIKHTLLMEAIFEKRIMSNAEEESFKAKVLDLDNTQMVKAIIDILMQKTRREFDLFIEALKKTGQNNISEVLTKDCKIITRNLYLQKYHPLLIKHVDFVKSHLWDEVVKLEVITAIQAEAIKDECPDNKDMVEAFIEHLKKRPFEDFENFVLALKTTGQHQIAECLSGALVDNEDWKECLRSEYCYLAEKVKLKNKNTKFWDSLKSTGVINQAQVEQILSKNKQRKSQVTALVDHLLKTSQIEYNKFLYCLKMTKQEHIAEHLIQGAAIFEKSRCARKLASAPDYLDQPLAMPAAPPAYEEQPHADVKPASHPAYTDDQQKSDEKPASVLTNEQSRSEEKLVLSTCKEQRLPDEMPRPAPEFEQEQSNKILDSCQEYEWKQSDENMTSPLAYTEGPPDENLVSPLDLGYGPRESNEMPFSLHAYEERLSNEIFASSLSIEQQGSTLVLDVLPRCKERRHSGEKEPLLCLAPEMPQNIAFAPEPAPICDIMEIERKIRNLPYERELPRCTPEWMRRKCKEEECYPVRHGTRGRAIVITMTGKREGWQSDLLNLAKLFKYLEFDVEWHYDLKYEEYEASLEQFAQSDRNSHVDCAWVFLMGHGGSLDNREYITSRDAKPLYIRSTMEKIFNNRICLTLQGKPKVFIVQKCRGNMRDHGVEVQKDKVKADAACGRVVKMGTFTDYLFGYATQEGHRAMRNIQTGSWYIQKLVQVFMEKARHTSVPDILQEVNREVQKLESDQGDVQTSEMSSVD